MQISAQTANLNLPADSAMQLCCVVHWLVAAGSPIPGHAVDTPQPPLPVAVLDCC